MVETARTVRECTMSDVIEAAIVAYLDPEASDDKLNMVLNQLAILIARTAPQEPSAAAAPPAEPVISSEAFYRKLGTWEVDLAAVEQALMAAFKSSKFIFQAKLPG